MKNRYLIVPLFLLSFKGQSQDSIPKKNFSYGLKATAYILSFTTSPILGIDYSIYAQYKRIGVFGGYSNIIGLTHKGKNIV